MTTKFKVVTYGVALPVALGFLLVYGSISYLRSVPQEQQIGDKNSKVAASSEVPQFPSGIAGAKQQMHYVVNLLRQSNWDPYAIDPRLLVIADDAAVPLPPQVLAKRSFGFGIFPTGDELAFVCDFYLKKRLQVVPGSEGTLHQTGVILVAFRNGTIAEVAPNLVRHKYFRWQGETIGLRVFPGMRDYDEALPLSQLPGGNIPELDPALWHRAPPPGYNPIGR